MHCLTFELIKGTFFLIKRGKIIEMLITTEEKPRCKPGTLSTVWSLDLQGFTSPKPGRVVSSIISPGKRASNRPQSTLWQARFISISRKRRSASPGSRISSLKHLHSSLCPTKQSYCTPLSCGGRSYPVKTDGRTSTGGFICTIPSVRWWTCSTVGGRKPSIPCGSYSMRSWLRLRNRAVENPTVFTQNPMKRFQIPTSRNPVLERRRAENRTRQVR